TNLRDILDAVITLFQERKDVRLQFETTITNATIFADKNQYISVFNNLVKNAIQATDENQDKIITVRLKQEDNFYQIRIEDNGVGIPENMHHKVFVPNFTTKSYGTGLGLAISKNIIENSGGNIWFESIEGESTTFYVLIPHYKL
ncbi:MAG: sensor histidine kinase, partial [Chitinophagales bacterium]